MALRRVRVGSVEKRVPFCREGAVYIRKSGEASVIGDG